MVRVLRICLSGLVALSVSTVAMSPALARPWKPTGKALAQDYLMINDTRPGNEIVLLWWIAPPLLDENARVAAQLLDQYFLLGVVHGRVDAGGAIRFDTVEPPKVAGSDGKPMKLVANDAMPPTVAGIMSALQTSLGQAIGAMGKGIQWTTFSGQAQACGKGTVSVSYAGETYTYDTPIPGCPKE